MIDELYDRSVVFPRVLYFGDYDDKGFMIPEAVKDCLETWGSNVSWKRIGLTKEQVEKYDLPENPDRKGRYQWEALPDEGAEEIISSALLNLWTWRKWERFLRLRKRLSTHLKTQ